MSVNPTWARHAKIQAAAERKYRAKIYSSLNVQTKAAADYFRAHGAEALKADLFRIIPIEPLLTTIRGLYADAGLTSAKAAYSSLPDPDKEQKDRGQMGISEDWLQRIRNYFRLYLLNKAVLPITETTKKRIREVLDEANNEGWGADKTAREIEGREVNRIRANVITRTETVRATNLGAMTGAASRGLKLQKEWIAVNDSRTRPDHRYLNGQTVDFEAKFETPENIALLYPGDPEAPAKEVIQCRCVLGFIPQRDDNDRLIRQNYEGLVL